MTEKNNHIIAVNNKKEGLGAIPNISDIHEAEELWLLSSQFNDNVSDMLSNNRFEKYGISFLSERRLHWPKRPSHYGNTPEFKYEKWERSVLKRYSSFLLEHYMDDFLIIDHRKAVLWIIDSIVKEVIGRSYSDFVNIIIMEKDDFIKCKQIMNNHMKSYGITGDYDWIALNGLLIIPETAWNNCFPLLFHEIGHNLYHPDDDKYIDELRAMYFEIMCTKKFEHELRKIWINVTYPDNDNYPSEHHRVARWDAKELFEMQLFHNIVTLDKNKQKLRKELLLKVKQKDEPFKFIQPE